MVSGMESREGPVSEALSAPLLRDLAEDDADLSFAQCVVCACTDVLKGCGSTAINFQHLQEPNSPFVSPFGRHSVNFRICPLLP